MWFWQGKNTLLFNGSPDSDFLVDHLPGHFQDPGKWNGCDGLLDFRVPRVVCYRTRSGMSGHVCGCNTNLQGPEGGNSSKSLLVLKQKYTL